ncbi:MAG TPA: RNA polymerase factor sigma-32 [Polyangiaceae bacterium]|nr:RNA polymerase factor sigma-32 [Polyangiaceae bacterium]
MAERSPKSSQSGPSRRKPTKATARSGKQKPSEREQARANQTADDSEQNDSEQNDSEETEGDSLDALDADLEDGNVIEVTGELIGDDALLAEPSLEERPVPADKSLARLDSLQVYMQEVQRHPLLTPEQERELAEEYHRTGNVDLAAKLVTANLRLVVKLAYEYRRAYRNIMDLVQEGNIGLMQAVKRYDPYRGVKLSSYAAWWIRAYMLRYILNNWRLVKLGTTQAQRKLFFNLNKEKAKLSAMGIEPSHAEIAKRLSVEEKDVVEMDRRLASSDASLDTPIGDADGRQTTRMDLLPSVGAGPDQLTESYQLQEMLREHLDDFKLTLSGKDLIIFERRMIADEPITLQELGEEFGVSRERVRQLEARLAGKLRAFLSERLGDAVLIRD